jgi:hypothetical protein
MSNLNAVAVATEGLKARLRETLTTMSPTITDAAVTSVRPNNIKPEFKGVNVFLYQVVPNAALRNDDLPTRRANGDLVRRPQLALDLHYLLTFAGEDLTLEPQRILGAALTGLHARPELTPADLADLASTSSDVYVQFNDLGEQIERVRFLLGSMNIEELSKLWAMFPQTAYNLCAAVQASVVLLEAPLTPEVSLPVLSRGLYSGTPRAPSIASIKPPITSTTVAPSGAGPRLPGSLTLEGAALAGATTRVRLGELAPVAAASASDTRVVVAMPPALPAGIYGASVLVGGSYQDRGGAPKTFELESNALPFVLAPRITTPWSPASPISASVGGVLTLGVEPALALRQRVRVVVGEHAIPVIPRPNPAVPDEPIVLITFTLPDEVAAGDHLLYIEVDGASSALLGPTDLPIRPGDPAAPPAEPPPILRVTP